MDAPALANAERRIAAVAGHLVSRPHELTNEAFERKIEALGECRCGLYIVAMDMDQIIGHALLDPMGLEAISHVVRLTIVVHSGNEGKGIGQMMLTHLTDWAKTAPGVEKIELNVRAVNQRAIRLYQKLGFNIEGRLKNRIRLPDSTFIDDLLMGYFVKAGANAPLTAANDWKPPTLTTNRLLLRPIEISDADAIFAYAKNPNVCRFTLWEAHQTVQDSIDYIKNYIFDYYSRGVPEPFGIALKENPRKIIGTVGCFWVSKSAKCMELAYAIAEDQWGKGIVAEASTAVIEYCRSEFGINRIQARCKSENEASAKVMQKIGMNFEGTFKSSLFHRDRLWDMHHYAKVF